MSYKFVDIAEFTCNGCGSTEFVAKGKGQPKGWKPGLFRMNQDFCPSCELCTGTCKSHCSEPEK
ncbi:hypothetical protein LCGC14_1417590 [marine sediment metagenome]|uniref:4Fe-4S ferredoxin-type domain-containing protein n=1 Tax=marine sediment metagenome TaxID=412755 RepID=A0A0F9JSR8_9ZZZZ